MSAEWAAGCGRPTAWLSLDQRDDDPSRFLTYLVAALRTIVAGIGGEVVVALQSPQPPPIESILTTIVNEISSVPDDFVLILDDYHVLDSRPDDEALAFLLEHLPPRMHLVIATREDPRLPIARLRARGQLTELRAADLRFTPAEATEFLKRATGLDLATDDVEALEARTEGWIAGLQMAAISLQGVPDAASFIRSFTGSHRFVLDYLLEEVLGRQPGEVQAFLLRTSVLDRLCGPLCDAVLCSPAGSGDETLQAIDRANLFVIPLDNERRWYRYHHLFGDLLRRRLAHSLSSEEIAGLHLRASEWYERDGQLLEAFQHATAANDVERAERLIDSDGMDLHLRGVLTPILDWLASLPRAVLEARPRLLVRSATLSLMAVQTTGVEEKLQAAERALQDVELDEETRDLIGQIACARATLAFTRYDVETMAVQARRAQEYLRPGEPALPLHRSVGGDVRPALRGRSSRRGSRLPGVCRPRREIRARVLEDAGDARRRARCGSWTTSSTRRPRATSTCWSLPASTRRRTSRKCISAWPVSATSGTTSMPPNGTGSTAGNWRGCTTARSTDPSPATSSWPA